MQEAKKGPQSQHSASFVMGSRTPCFWHRFLLHPAPDLHLKQRKFVAHIEADALRQRRSECFSRLFSSSRHSLEADPNTNSSFVFAPTHRGGSSKLHALCRCRLQKGTKPTTYLSLPGTCLQLFISRHVAHCCWLPCLPVRAMTCLLAVGWCCWSAG